MSLLWCSIFKGIFKKPYEVPQLVNCDGKKAYSRVVVYHEPCFLFYFLQHTANKPGYQKEILKAFR